MLHGHFLYIEGKKQINSKTSILSFFFQNHGSRCDTHGTTFNRFEMLNLFLTYFNNIIRSVLGFINIFISKTNPK